MAMRLLNRLIVEEDYYYSTLTKCLATTAVYCSVIDAHAKSGSDLSRQAEKVLSLMFERYRAKQGLNVAKPNTVAFNATLDAYAKMTLSDTSKKNSGRRLPPKSTDEIVLLSYTDIAERAEQLLNWMHVIDGVEPDTISYNAVLVCLTRAGLASRAEALHNEMETLYKSGNHPNLCPNTHTFTTVCNAWARSGENGAAERASAILKRMIQLAETNPGCSPNVKVSDQMMAMIGKSNETDLTFFLPENM